MVRHKNTTPGSQVKDDAVARAFIAVATEQGWSPISLRTKLLAFYDKHATSLPSVDDTVVPSEATIRRVIDKGAILTRDFEWFIEKWLTADFPEHLAIELRIRDQPFVAHCRAVMGLEADPMPDKMNKYVGHYALYRPFHLRPRQQVIVERFSIGENGNPFACELSSRYPHITADDGTDSEGLCVPHGRKLMAVMTVQSDKYSQIIIYFDRVHTKNHRTETSEPTVIAMTGIMMASVGDADDASAWPVYLQRVESKDQVNRRVVSGLDIGQLPELAQKSLQRGSVYWDAKDYVQPFGSLV